MKWIRERDALIAQTLAFVQSVTGRKEETLLTGSASVPPPIAMEVTSVVVIEDVREVEQPPQTAPPPQPFQVSPPRRSGDFRSEVLARVANFRKHQERFEREREEFCQSTLAKVRDAISNPPPRPPAAT
ncbi:hypothetical protein [Bradyrhizobium iriomotense]|uniref:Uncharacterized protein n=1 Tax=Bradyrhizobium iriomotense TaxID=441950 RepID=A0ABQ6AQ01_9BRAD|nr:hypothetical protein [Bradyrhizobium iriomotense]GLR83326.1 hypothetical protein GCM10007857_00360 [Bradyrhizobium iriomotense]